MASQAPQVISFIDPPNPSGLLGDTYYDSLSIESNDNPNAHSSCCDSTSHGSHDDPVSPLIGTIFSDVPSKKSNDSLLGSSSVGQHKPVQTVVKNQSNMNVNGEHQWELVQFINKGSSPGSDTGEHHTTKIVEQVIKNILIPLHQKYHLQKESTHIVHVK